MQPFLTAEFHLVTCTCLRCNSDIQSQSWLQLVIQACSTSIQQSAFQQEHPVKHKEHHSNRVLHTTFASVESQPSHFTDSSYVLTVPPPFHFWESNCIHFFSDAWAQKPHSSTAANKEMQMTALAFHPMNMKLPCYGNTGTVLAQTAKFPLDLDPRFGWLIEREIFIPLNSESIHQVAPSLVQNFFWTIKFCFCFLKERKYYHRGSNMYLTF